jgi:hypothetical protein
MDHSARGRRWRRPGCSCPTWRSPVLTPRGLVELAPPEGSRWSLRAVLVAGTDVPARLCVAAPAGGGCTTGAAVTGVSPSLLPDGSALHIPGVWLVLVRGSALADPIRAG